MPDQNKRDYLERRRGALKTELQSFIPHYRELSEFIQPRRGRFFITDRNKGDKRYGSIINSKATQALRIARSGMLAGVMSPSRPWFALATPDQTLMEFGPVKIWLHDVELLMREIFNQSNLYNMAPVLIGELLNFGTAAMLQVDDFEDVARFYTYTAGQYMLGQNERLEVDTLCREFEMQVSQIVEKYGLDNVSQSVKQAYDRGDYDQWYPVVHFIEPNREDYRAESKLSKNFPFRSCVYEPGNVNKDKFLQVSGFMEFPVYAPRWDVTGQDVYGTDCPAMTALGDIKGLQIEERRKAQAIDKLVNPPLKGPASLRNVPINSLPGGLTVYDGDSTREGLSPIYEVRPELQNLLLDIQHVERRIEEAFYVDMFLAFNNIEGIQPRNELDLTIRNQERLLQLGPVLERFHGEFLRKLIDRTFNQMVRAGILPPPPPELEGQDLKVEFISSLAMAQRAVATSSIERVAAYTGGLAEQGWVGALDKFDADQSVDEYGQAVGVPPRIIRTDDAVAEIREQREQKQQQQQQMQILEQVAGAAQKGAKAVKDVSGA